MTELRFLEFMTILSLTLQAFVIVLAMLAYTHVENRRAWKWFVLASLVVFVRRFTGTYEVVTGMNTNILESIETAAISIMWIAFILIRTDRLRSNPEGLK